MPGFVKDAAGTDFAGLKLGVGETVKMSFGEVDKVKPVLLPSGVGTSGKMLKLDEKIVVYFSESIKLLKPSEVKINSGSCASGYTCTV